MKAEKATGRFSTFNFPDIRRVCDCILVFLAIAVPAVIALCLLIGPLQALDEASHFYRSIQVSEGRILPARSPANDAAGDYLDKNVRRIGGYYADLSYNRWSKSFGSGPEDLSGAWSTHLSGQREFTKFSNTVIYLPLAHIVPALGIALARQFDDRPITWIYAGRLINGAVALGIICVAMAYFDQGRAFLFPIALLPRTLFGIASLSPDALLVPMAMLFAALVAQLASGRALGRGEHALLFLSSLFLCTSKLAYIPMVIIPPVIAGFTARKISREVVLLTVSALVITVVWLVWMRLIGPNVFPIRHNVHIDIYTQLHLVVRDPLRGVTVLKHTFSRTGLGYFNTMVGGALGSEQARFSQTLSMVTFMILATASFTALEQARTRWLELLFALFILTGVAVGIFLLLYMQYTEVGHDMVDGVQGRYFVPLLPVIVAFLPKATLRRVNVRMFSGAVILWMAFAATMTVKLIDQRYTHAVAVPGLRFSKFTHTDVE